RLVRAVKPGSGVRPGRAVSTEASELVACPLLALLLVCLAGSASAQVAPEPIPVPSEEQLTLFLANPATTAAEAYEVGVRLFEAQRYEAAETAWLRAHSLGRDPILLLAIADTRQRRLDEPGAVAMLEQYLSERPDAPDRVAIEARIAALLQSPAVLLVRSDAPGDSILLDGMPVDDKTPASLEVAPGMHTVTVVGDGKPAGEMKVQVGYGESRELDFASNPESEASVAQSEEAESRRQLALDDEDTTIRRAVIATGSIAAVALVTGSILGGLALRQERDDQKDPTREIVRFTEVSLGLAVLSGITSVTLHTTHRNKRKRERESAGLRIEIRGSGAAATLRF
ncbi:MAG: PEGA domain-containing protein, partial [Polyangiales bacterium]